MDTERTTGTTAMPGDHPTDRLPDYVRGATSRDEDAVRTHLAACARCRQEVELLRALAATDPALRPEERERLWARVRAEHVTSRSGAGRSAWPAAAWKVAAAVALLITGLGVWQVNRQAAAGGEWNPTAALRGWDEDLAALRPAPEDVRLALGWEVDGSDVPWDEMEAGDPAALEAPWEENRP